MPRLRRYSVALVATIGLLASVPRASADTVTLTLNDGGTAIPSGFSFNGSADSGGAGPFHWTQTAPVSASITTYCIDLTHYISTGGSYTYTTVPFTSTTTSISGTSIDTTAKVDAIEALFNKYYSIGLSGTADEQAFQVALWKLEYDGPSSSTTSLTTGTIQLAGDTSTTLAQEMLNGTLASSHNDLWNASLTALVSGTGNQNQIEVVPAPPALILAGIGALALCGRARWTRRAAVPA